MRRVSIAEARDTLPKLVHEAEREPIELLRRGKPVAVIVSRTMYERYSASQRQLWPLLERFRAAHDLDALDLADALDETRDRTTGRRVRL